MFVIRYIHVIRIGLYSFLNVSKNNQSKLANSCLSEWTERERERGQWIRNKKEKFRFVSLNGQMTIANKKRESLSIFYCHY